jgi:hypothetical protein
MKMLSMCAYFLVAFLILTACSGTPQIQPTSTQISPTPTIESPTKEFTPTPKTTSTPVPFPTNVRIEDDTEYRIPSMMGFDAIAPIYNPSFSSVAQAPLEDTELVMGVAFNGEAKAYPVNVLRFREMVNDELAGWPILVTW